MNLNISYDSSVNTSAPSAFKTAVNFVVNLYDHLFTNSVTVNIDVGYGEIHGQTISPGDLGESQLSSGSDVFVTYNQVRNQLVARGASGSATLPTSDPTGGQFLVMSSAEEKALGFVSSANPALDGYVGFGSGVAFSYAANVTPAQDVNYFIAVVEHEFSEVMGRESALNFPGLYTPMDLFRYAAPGQRQPSETGAPSYFSIDGGNTDLADLNNHGADPFGDLGDWAPSAGNDAFDAEGLPGVLNVISASDLTLMNALGWTEAPLPSVSTPNIANATRGQQIALSSLVPLSDPGNVGYATLELWDTNGTVGTGQFVINGVAQTAGHVISVSPADVSGTVFDVGTYGGTDTLYAQLLESTGVLSGWQAFTVTAPAVPPPTLSVSNDATATAGQHIALSNLVTIGDPSSAGYGLLELWDTNGTVGTGEFVVNGVAQTGGHEIDVSPANAGSVVFNAGTLGGSDVLYARLLESNGQLTPWQSYTVTVALPALSVSNDPTATAGQQIALSSLVAIRDPGNVGYNQLELWDTNGTVGGGEFKLSGTAQTGGHVLYVAPGNVANSVFSAGTLAGSDQLYARLLENNGQETAWQIYTVTVPLPTLNVSNNSTATAGQHVALSSLVTLSDPGNVGYTTLELWDTNGTVGSGEFVVNGVAQTGGHEIDVSSANAGTVTFNVGTYGGSDQLYARLLESNGQLTPWQIYAVTAPSVAPPTLSVSSDPTATAGQHIALSNLVTIGDPASAGYSLLELWDTNGTAAGGQFVVNGVVQTGGHEIDVSPANVANTVFNAGTLGGSDQLYARLLESNGQLTPWQIYTVTVPLPTVSVSNDATATAGQHIALSSLVTLSDPGNVGYTTLELWDTNGTAAGGQFVVNGVAQTGGHEIDVSPANAASTVFNAGTLGGSDQLYARLLESNGQLTPWQIYTVTVPLPTLSVSNDATATAGQHIALSSLVTLSDPGNVGYTTLELWDTNGTVGTGEFVVNGVAQTGGHEIDVSPANVASTVFNAGTLGGSDQLYARLLESNGQLTPWQIYTVTVPLPTLSVSNDSTTTAGQHIALSNLVTLSDPGNVGYTTLELWDTNGTVGSGEFVVNGVAQTGGHEIDVSPANVASTVFNVGTYGGSDQLYARLLENNGQLTPWQIYTVTAPAVSPPTLSVSNDPLATAGQQIALSSLVTISDPASAGYSLLELWDTNGTAAGGQFVVNSVAQTGGHEIDVTPANVAGATFNVGTPGSSDVLYARLLESNGQLTAWQSYTVSGPSLGSQAASLVSAMASFSAVGSEAVANPSAQAPDPLTQLNLAAAHH